jgi:uncharacterized membrane protein
MVQLFGIAIVVIGLALKLRTTLVVVAAACHGFARRVAPVHK